MKISPIVICIITQCNDDCKTIYKKGGKKMRGNQNNADLRQAAKRAGVYFWQIAAVGRVRGIHDPAYAARSDRRKAAAVSLCCGTVKSRAGIKNAFQKWKAKPNEQRANRERRHCLPLFRNDRQKARESPCTPQDTHQGKRKKACTRYQQTHARAFRT